MMPAVAAIVPCERRTGQAQPGRRLIRGLNDSRQYLPHLSSLHSPTRVPSLSVIRHLMPGRSSGELIRCRCPKCILRNPAGLDVTTVTFRRHAAAANLSNSPAEQPALPMASQPQAPLSSPFAITSGIQPQPLNQGGSVRLQALQLHLSTMMAEFLFLRPGDLEFEIAPWFSVDDEVSKRPFCYTDIPNASPLRLVPNHTSNQRILHIETRLHTEIRNLSSIPNVDPTSIDSARRAIIIHLASLHQVKQRIWQDQHRASVFKTPIIDTSTYPPPPL